MVTLRHNPYGGRHTLQMVRFILVSVIVAITFFTGERTASASHLHHVYCGAPNYVYPNYPCHSGLQHTYDYNVASYYGAGSFFFCESLGTASGSQLTRYSYNCRNIPGDIWGSQMTAA